MVVGCGDRGLMGGCVLLHRARSGNSAQAANEVPGAPGQFSAVAGAGRPFLGAAPCCCPFVPP